MPQAPNMKPKNNKIEQFFAEILNIKYINIELMWIL